MSAEIIQVKKTRIVPVHHCLAVESEFSQYYGHSSAAGVLQILKFRENCGIDSEDCRNAFAEKGKVTVGGKEFLPRLGEMTSHSQFLTGDLDDSSHCSVGTHEAGGKKLGYQTAQRVLEISLFIEQGKINDAAGPSNSPTDSWLGTRMKQSEILGQVHLSGLQLIGIAPPHSPKFSEVTCNSMSAVPILPVLKMVWRFLNGRTR